MCSTFSYKPSICGFRFGKPLVVRIDGTFFQHKIKEIFLDPICAVHLEMSPQFAVSVFGIVGELAEVGSVAVAVGVVDR